MFYYGQGGKTDYEMAREYFKLAADQGYPDAQHKLDMMLHTEAEAKKAEPELLYNDNSGRNAFVCVSDPEGPYLTLIECENAKKVNK